MNTGLLPQKTSVLKPPCPRPLTRVQIRASPCSLLPTPSLPLPELVGGSSSGLSPSPAGPQLPQGGPRWS